MLCDAGEVAVFEKGIRKAEKKKEYAGLCALEERV